MNKRNTKKLKQPSQWKRFFVAVILLVIATFTILLLPSILSRVTNRMVVQTTAGPHVTNASPTSESSSQSSAFAGVLPTTASSQKTTVTTPSANTIPSTLSSSSVKNTIPASTAKTTATIGSATSARTTTPLSGRLAGKVVVLDPGHQQKANYETEPISPGSTIMKAKVSSGTSGVVTHRAEYIVNLEISLKLRQFLEAKGCIVYMTRSTNDVNISNIERATFAVAKNPDVFIRIHCNGSSDSAANGVKVFVADTGIYKAKLPTWGRLLATCQSATTGAKNLGVNAGSTYTGLNWATDIPSFLLEMGFMSNAAEDRLLSTPDYQDRICHGIADFIQQMPKR